MATCVQKFTLSFSVDTNGVYDGCSQSGVTLVQHRRAYCLTGCVEIYDVKVEHPVWKVCPNSHMGLPFGSGKDRNTHTVYAEHKTLVLYMH